MQFVYPLPWWGWLLAVVAAALVAGGSYARASGLRPQQRALLAALRCAALLSLAVFLARPVRFVPPASPPKRPLPILVDVSRSMALKNADGTRRIDQASQVLQERQPQQSRQSLINGAGGLSWRPRDGAPGPGYPSRSLLAALSEGFEVDLLTFGEELASGDPSNLEPDARRSDLTGALQAVQDRYRGRAVPAVILISDGGDTGRANLAPVMPARQCLPWVSGMQLGAIERCSA